MSFWAGKEPAGTARYFWRFIIWLYIFWRSACTEEGFYSRGKSSWFEFRLYFIIDKVKSRHYNKYNFQQFKAYPKGIV